MNRSKAERTLKNLIWGGFLSLEEIKDKVSFEFEDELDEDWIHDKADRLWEAKLNDQSRWPSVTDCDLLYRALGQLQAQRSLIYLEYLDGDMAHVMSGVRDEQQLMQATGRSGRGVCYYHRADVERALAGEPMNVYVRALSNDKFAGRDLGIEVSKVLSEAGFSVSWDSHPDRPLRLVGFEWKNRFEEPEI